MDGTSERISNQDSSKMENSIPASISNITIESTTPDATVPSLTDTTTSPPTPKESSFLSLPAEVRNRIYEWCLCPTTVLCLTRTRTSRLSTTPTLIPQLLSTCKKIYHECGRNRSYLFENEICLSLDAHDTSWPVISETRLPQHVLERVENICMIFDCTGNFRASYEDVDFTALTALTSLKKLRLGVIFDEESGYPDVFCVAMLEEVLMRLPKEIDIVWGIEKESEQGRFLETVLNRRREGRKIPDAIKAMEAERLQSSVAAVDESLRGAKSGGVEDVFAEYRMEPSSVGRRFGRQSDFAV